MPTIASNLFHDILVAFEARFLGDASVAPGDLNFIWKVLRRESKRMEESIQGFRVVLRDETRRSMTIIADCHLSMTAFQPAFELVSHHVAIGARRWIIRHVRRPASITERIKPNAQ